MTLSKKNRRIDFLLRSKNLYVKSIFHLYQQKMEQTIGKCQQKNHLIPGGA